MRLLAKEETPLDWTSKKIGSYVLGHKGGAALRPSDFSDVGFPVIPKKAIQPTGELLIESPTYCTNEFASNNKRSIVDNSYTITTLRDLVPTGPTIGTVVNFTSEEKYILSQGVYGLKLNDDLDKKYLSYLSNTSFYRKVMQRIMVGSTQVHIRTPEYLDLEIQIPPLLEQQKIANILSTWDKAISTTERLIENSTQQKKALMQQLLTGKKRLLDNEGKRFEGEWEEVTLEEAVKYRRGSFPQPYGNPEWVDEVNGYPFVQVYDIAKNMKLKPDTKIKISDAAIDKSVFIPKETIIVSLQGSIGRVAITQYDAYVDRTILLFQEFLVPLNKMFFAYIIQELFEIEKTKAPGGTIKTITKAVLSNFKVLIPPLKEQQKIATVLTNADKEIELLEQQLADLQQEKKSLMQVLLTGKVRVVVDGEVA